MMETQELDLASGEIKKTIIKRGKWGLKPTENCQCSIKISYYEGPGFEEYCNLESFVIGDCKSKFERLLDRCLTSMLPGEVAKLTFTNFIEKVTLTLELISFIDAGLICEWTAQQKYNLAFKHKSEGVELFKKSHTVDASYRFSKGLKILCSIPIDVTEPPLEIDGIKVEDIENLKSSFYNNLASCYLKNCDYESVLLLCDKVFERDKNNVKALYKQSVAKRETCDFEGSQEILKRILELEPNNKIVGEKLKAVNVKVAEERVRVNAMIKKMFQSK